MNAGHSPFTMKTWKNGVQIECLRVPLYTQPDEEPSCFAFCVKMVLGYYNNIYPERRVRNHVNDLNIDEIVKILDIKEDGWTINKKRLQTLGEKAGPLEFIYSERNELSVLEDNLSNHKPKIVLFDKFYLLGRDFEWIVSMLHSAVVIGLDNQKKWIVLNDPWGEGYEKIPITDFLEAWERSNYAIVDINIKPIEKQLNLGCSNSFGGGVEKND